MTEPSSTHASVKVRPRVWIGLAIYVGYIIVVFSVQAFSGVPYDKLGESGTNLFFGAGLSLIIAAVLLAITTTLLGWWRPALFDRHHSRARGHLHEHRLEVRQLARRRLVSARPRPA
ncbi:hypothetical protein QCD70_09120 [Agreia sp. PsM10]|uniref:hypothetical protein n=1 Tax=Agreia sp. PsM10 TaxID=3030533 RepID=UPI00263A9A0C|nr:hypothetical protein [Agreia sp. PsM10]MDN4640401.1 hypothetical protein [Agreia sp. PsM10]